VEIHLAEIPLGMTAPVLMNPEIRIGIDIGGTFTDFVIYDTRSKRLDSFKLPSTPANPAEAVLEGLSEIKKRLPENAAIRVVHGSTVATNALLERKGARTALVTPRGFKDLLQIGRQNRPALYDFFVEPPPPLVPDNLRFEVIERVGAEGQILTPLDHGEVERLVKDLTNQQVVSAAVCLLFSFLHPQHEALIGETLREAGFSVSLSCEVLPEYREYERASTTTVNAYVAPVMDHYLGQLETQLSQADAGGQITRGRISLRVMQSNGGQIGLSEARRQAVRCILSGPAGGVVGAMRTGERVAQLEKKYAYPALKQPLSPIPNRLITFDMGGTSTDVSLIDGRPMVTTESVVGGCPIRIPVLDIHTIGAGGGSIASVDAGGALRVGPESAGAEPGPACYGRSLLPTVTDANLVLGRLAPEHFLGGKMELSPSRSLEALYSLGKQLGLDARQAALGVIEVVNAHMERALRLISIERGRDPGRTSGEPFTLLSFGGAGGLHAVDLARRLDIPFVCAPPLASTLSAYGMLAADIVMDYTKTVMLKGEDYLIELEGTLDEMAQNAAEDVSAEGARENQISIERLVDVRYAGQSYELTIPFSRNLLQAFHDAHLKVYGYNRDEAPIEIVNARVRGVGKADDPSLDPLSPGDPDPSTAFIEQRQVVGGKGQDLTVPFYKAELLKPGNRLEGPAVVVRVDTTLWIPPGDRAEIDGFGNTIIQLA
jgi:N-methylhydantoinase A